MDPRDRADAILARARARGAYVVTPDSAISPMDAAATLQIPRAVVAAIDEEDPDVTLVFPVAAIQAELPAIAQEATTQSFPSPARPVPRQSAPGVERVEGMLPTVRQHPGRPSLSQRLDGDGQAR
ncbi:hypothetical protein [Actinokineospora sp. NBRC 105648]|uniref:hypothetical protein n=1 Tax=Actinokineospora sp. NBRC 105648 TaxID=3032206 RepID=UPI0024A5A7C8|nr:hypothetical protein [Actinokineospora sp. NBRC 105648]GLZ38503.1 hypothetical protein Acsp05_21270 [Actinokineospora sp. NBRC 105648]